MLIDEQITIEIEQGATIADACKKLADIEQSAIIGAVSITASYQRVETTDERAAREAVEQRQLDVKAARQALQAAIAAQSAIAESKPQAVKQ